MPVIFPEERAAYQDWLRSIGFLVPGEDDETWETIKSNWAAFLAATTKEKGVPNAEFRQRRAIQAAVSELMDGLEVMAERWPRRARATLNRWWEGDDGSAFESAGAQWQLGRRRRLQAIWTGMLSFASFCGSRGLLEDMGLEVEEGELEKLVEIGDEARRPYGFDEGAGLGEVIREVTEDALGKEQAWAGRNVLVWWTAILVRSALCEDGEEDYISRGGWRMNVLPIDMRIADKVEAIGHYSRAAVLDLAFRKFREREGGPGWARALDGILEDLNAVDNEWLNGESRPRPERTGVDDGRLSTAGWKAMLGLLGQEARKRFGRHKKSALRRIGKLYKDLEKLEAARLQQTGPDN